VQDVAVELRRDAGRVVVGRLDDRRVLDQVRPEQEGVALAQHAAHVAQQSPAAAGREVPDRAAEERHEPPAAVRRGDLAEVALEVADHAVHLQAGVVVDQLVGGLAHHPLGHVHGDIPRGTVHRVEQHARLQRGARAQLDQLRRGARRRDDLARAVPQDRRLGARRVVLGQLADGLEQLRAARVVEVLGRDLLERLGEAVQRVVGQAPLGALADVDVDDRVHASLAIRTPEKIWRRRG
jgi:hypothetical protein